MPASNNLVPCSPSKSLNWNVCNSGRTLICLFIRSKILNYLVYGEVLFSTHTISSCRRIAYCESPSGKCRNANYTRAEGEYEEDHHENENMKISNNKSRKINIKIPIIKCIICSFLCSAFGVMPRRQPLVESRTNDKNWNDEENDGDVLGRGRTDQEDEEVSKMLMFRETNT